MAAYTIENLKFSYPDNTENALDDINLKIEKGEYLLICGRSGSGKSTLLRHLKSVLTPYGSRAGRILFGCTPLEEVDLKQQSRKIGFVLQNPENQIVTDKVWSELAFGLENLGEDTQTIRLKVAEMASFFGIEQWFEKNINELSGGQKQILNLASVMVMQPEVLILDEPTSQLDPIASIEFLQAVHRINRELFTTVILSEQRLEEVFPICDRAAVMDKGKIISCGKPEDIVIALKEQDHEMFKSMPVPIRVWNEVGGEKCPLNVRDGRKWLSSIVKDIKIDFIPFGRTKPSCSEIAVSLKNIRFKYKKNDRDVLRDFNLKIPSESVFCILGGNGAGKTTALGVVAGILKPYYGRIKIFERDISKYKKDELYKNCIAMLPQNPQSLFVEETVERDLNEVFDNDNSKQNEIRDIAEQLDIVHLLNKHPFDLSGGEKQRAALAKVLLIKPKILLLDEPTKGLDNHFKIQLANILSELKSKGMTIIMVSHDVEFCAMCGDYCAYIFDGNIVSSGTTHAFFAGNTFYTTAANRMSRHLFKNAVTVEEVVELCRKNM